jgi:hypothetical protein
MKWSLLDSATLHQKIDLLWPRAVAEGRTCSPVSVIPMVPMVASCDMDEGGGRGAYMFASECHTDGARGS